MIDKRKLVVASTALVLALAAGMGLSFATMEDAPGVKTEAELVVEREEAIQDACASSDTFQGLKKLVFDQASRIRTGERVNFDVLAATAFPRMENPVATSRDEALDVTACTGRFILELPPGAERAFGGERRLVADVSYEVQPAADGSGPVYRMSGAEAIVSQLAGFELEGEPLQLPQDVLDAATVEDNESIALEPPGFEPPAFPPETGRRDQRAPAGEWSSPSFDCRDAQTRSEIMVCGSDRLARRDRGMAEDFNSAMAAAGPRTRQALIVTRDNFLAYRERCRSNACIEEAYEDRRDEIRDIMRDAD